MNGSIIIDTPDGIHKFRLLQLIHGLSLEINTGMKISRGGKLLDVVASLGYKGKTTGTVKNKQAGLKWVVEQMGPNYVPSSSVTRALAKEA